MKNSMKKIAAVISASILGALPMTGSLTANAASRTLADDTVKYYFGDVNLDGKISASDAQTVLRWANNGVAGVSADKRKRADVDGDGNISVADANKILAYYTDEVVCHNKVYGDANGDGRVNMTDAYMVYEYVHSGSYVGQINLVAADVNGDGKVNTVDHVLIARYDQDMIPTLYVRWGDVDSNGVINEADTQKLARLCAEDSSVRFTDAEFRRADLNLSGNVDTDDVLWLVRYEGRHYFDWNC